MASRGRVSAQGYVRLLRSPVVRGLWIAQVQSVVGDRLYALAMMWLIWQATHSAFLMGLGAVAESVPYIAFGTIFKRYLDQFASLRRLAAVDVVRAVIVGSVPLLWGGRVGEVAALLSAAFLLGVLGALFDPNLGALVPELAEPEQVRQVTGLMDLTGRVARVAGPGTAGLLLLVVPAVGLYAVDAVTFAVSAALLLRVSRYVPVGSRAATRRGKAAAGPRASGRVLLRRSPQLAVVIAVHGVGTLGNPAAGFTVAGLVTVLAAVAGLIVAGRLAGPAGAAPHALTGPFRELADCLHPVGLRPYLGHQAAGQGGRGTLRDADGRSIAGRLLHPVKTIDRSLRNWRARG